jgi:hypothetical protein
VLLAAPQFIYHPPAGDSIAWTNITSSLTGNVPNGAAQVKLHYDPLSGNVLVPQIRNDQSGIYASNWWSLNPNTYVMTRIGGTTGSQNGCTNYPLTGGGWDDGSGSDVLPWPSDRHYDFMGAIDTTRNILIQFSGLACSDGPSDTWQWTLNATPTSNVWLKRTPATTPNTPFGASTTYDSVHDVFVMVGQQGGGIGNTFTWIYCPDTELNGLSSPQTTAGCDTANDWQQVHEDTAQVTLTPANLTYEGNVIYDPTANRVRLFRAFHGAAWTVQTAVFNLESTGSGWTVSTPTGAPSNNTSNANNEFLWARISSGTLSGKFVFVRTGHLQAGDAGQAGVWLFDAGTNTMTPMTVSGTGPIRSGFVTYVPTIGSNGGLIFQELVGVGVPNIYWRGVF